MNFDKVIRVLTDLSSNSIMSANRYYSGRVIDVLSDIPFVLRGFEQYTDYDVLRLQILDTTMLCSLFLGEANRFLLAALVSLNRALQLQENNVSWQIVEIYYAAYYAAHYLIRTSGVSITNIDSNFIAKIKSNIGSSGSVKNLQSGIYEVFFDERYDLIILIKTKKKNPGGSHKELWNQWYQYVDKLIDFTSLDIQEYASEGNFLLSHKNFIVRSGYCTPKEIRSEINYQFKHKVWMFENQKRKI